MSSKIVLIGGTGFVGTSFQSLFKNEFNIVCSGSKIDISQKKTIKEYINHHQPNYVINLAAITTLKEVESDKDRAFDIMVQGNANLLEVLAGVKSIKSYLYISSSEVYDHNYYPENYLLDENSKTIKSSYYANNKLEAEAQCLKHECNFSINIARPFTHFGFYQKNKFGYIKIIDDILDSIKNDENCSLRVGDINSSRDLLDINDVCQAYKKILLSSYNKEIFNICSGELISIKDFISHIQNIIGVDISLVSDKDLYRTEERSYKCGTFSKIKTLLSWEPKIDIEKSIKSIINLKDDTKE